MLCLFIPPSPSPWQPLIFLLCPEFCHFQNVIVGIIHMYPFHTGFFHLVMCIYDSAVSFRVLLACFFMSLNDIPFYSADTTHVFWLLRGVLRVPALSQPRSGRVFGVNQRGLRSCHVQQAVAASASISAFFLL